ncbi:MAG: hypothetical protein HDR88_15285 [Bacteroides sp.]|nr:hypothetical protein [Bacteroides sp.]
MRSTLILFLVVLIVSCSRPRTAHYLFRWESVSPEADSLIVALERDFIDYESSDTILSLISRLDSLAEMDIKLRPKTLFWRGRIINRNHDTREARKLLNQAFALNDSANAPYTHSRIKYLMTILNTHNLAKRYSELKTYEHYYEKTSDGFMLANISLDLGHIMRGIGDIKRAMGYYMKADSLYEQHGIDTYHLKTSLNNSTLLYEAGDTVESQRIMKRLLSDDKAKEDIDFYIDVLTQSYKILGDTTLLLKAWDAIEKRGLKLMDMREPAFELTDYYLVRNNVLKADSFFNIAMETISEVTGLEDIARASRLLAQVQEMKGERDSALLSYKLHIDMQDRLLQERVAVDISNLESRSEIERSEAEIASRHKIERLWTWIFVMALVVLALIIALLLLRKIQASKLSITRYHLDLERERRSLVSSALVMEEKDNVLESVLADIHKMEQAGKLKSEETRHLEQNVKMHLSGRQDWDHFRELFDNVHPLFHKRLKETYPELTEGDLRLATYIKVGMQGKQIARMLMLQPDTVRKNRQKLRRHLNLSSEESLEDLLRSIDS